MIENAKDFWRFIVGIVVIGLLYFRAVQGVVKRITNTIVKIKW